MKSVFQLVLFSLLNYAAVQTDEVSFEEKPVRASNANIPNRKTSSHLGEPCITPGGEQGNCMYLDDCPILANLFANPINHIGSKEFIFKFACAPSRSLYVCCTPGWNSTNYGKGLSDRRYCGYQHTDDYFRTGNTTSIDEFPWLAALVGTDPDYGKDKIVCHGSLINNRYILTTAYCTSPSNLYSKSYKTLKVLLGKYHAGNTTGCVDHEEYGLECTEEQEFGIEEVIRHPFSNYASLALFDIGLIRLNKTASYTDYIRPICLPTQGTKFAGVGEALYMTGWGAESYYEKMPIKKKVKAILATSEKCQDPQKVLSTHHICTLRTENISGYPCINDRGAPVMYSYRNQWQIEGIVLFDFVCNVKYPILHIRVAPYIDWIKQTIRP